MIPDGLIHDIYETMTDIMMEAVLNLPGGKPVLPYGEAGLAFLPVQGVGVYGGREYQSVGGK